MQYFPIIVETVVTRQRNEIVDVTPLVQKLVTKRGVMDAMVVVYCPHTTTAVTVNENYDPDVKTDLLAKLEKLVPQLETYYQHDEGNSDAHVKAAMIGSSVTLLVESGRLVLGKWQGVWFCEFDGPRERRLMVKMVDFTPDAR